MTTARRDTSLRVLVTGADGFVGRHLEEALVRSGHDVRLAVRTASGGQDSQRFAVGDIGPETDWQIALAEIDVVVHLAARAHVLRETAADPRREFMRVNAEATATLVSAAAHAGVRRVVYLSSIGVHGKKTTASAFTETSPLTPHNLYAQSKLAGEEAARAAAGSKVEVVVVRPPLVYGSGVRANFLHLVQAVDRGWPLPLGSIDNKRSLVSVWNLCDLLSHLITSPIAPSQAWVVSDGEDLSTPDLIRRIGTAMGRPTRLLPVPARMLRALGTIAGRGAAVASLCDSLVIDMESTRSRLRWTPPVSLNEGLIRTIKWYLSNGQRQVGKLA